MNETIGMDALLMAAAISMLGRKRKMQNDPEYAAKEKEREALAAEARFDAQYTKAHIDHEEYKRSPRAFMRRLTQSKDEQPR